MGIDDLLKQIQEDERNDRLETQTLATPIEYARSRGFAPQKVYASLRNGKLEWHECNCGGRRVNIEEADELYGVNDADEEADEGTDSDGDQVSELADSETESEGYGD